MRVNIDLSDIQSKDTIIAANNRQALAIKQSMRLKSGTSKMPKIFSYQSWIEKFWRSNHPTKEYRLLSQLELRFMLKKFCKDWSRLKLNLTSDLILSLKRKKLETIALVF